MSVSSIAEVSFGFLEILTPWPCDKALEVLFCELDGCLPSEMLAYSDLLLAVVPKTFGKTRLKRERMAGMHAQRMPTGTSIVLQ